jgi:hypothetical protein
MVKCKDCKEKIEKGKEAFKNGAVICQDCYTRFKGLGSKRRSAKFWDLWLSGRYDPGIPKEKRKVQERLNKRKRLLLQKKSKKHLNSNITHDKYEKKKKKDSD